MINSDANKLIVLRQQLISDAQLLSRLIILLIILEIVSWSELEEVGDFLSSNMFACKELHTKPTFKYNHISSHLARDAVKLVGHHLVQITSSTCSITCLFVIVR